MLQDELAKALDLSKGQLSKYKARGCPVDDAGKAKAWLAANVRQRAKRKKAQADPTSEEAKDIPPALLAPTDPDHTWEARLERAWKMEYCLFETIRNAINANQLAHLSTLLVSWQKAYKGLVDAERDSQEIRRQAGELIHRETVKAIMGEMLNPIRNALDLLPITERNRCNPAQPETAQEALTHWRDALLHRLAAVETKF